MLHIDYLFILFVKILIIWGKRMFFPVKRKGPHRKNSEKKRTQAFSKRSHCLMPTTSLGGYRAPTVSVCESSFPSLHPPYSGPVVEEMTKKWGDILLGKEGGCHSHMEKMGSPHCRESHSDRGLGTVQRVITLCGDNGRHVVSWCLLLWTVGRSYLA